jgi:hypothetical protein
MAAKRQRTGPVEHPAISSPDALFSTDASLPALLAALEGLELDGLGRQWRNHLGGEAPAHLPRWLLLKLLGHRLQVAAFGDLDNSLRRLLRDELEGSGDRNSALFDRRGAHTRDGIALRPGALLVREWKGKIERVMVLEEGFAWNGKSFGSLSQIAKAMTGTNWNGHRFFGLRQAKAKPAIAKRSDGRRSSGDRADSIANAAAVRPARAGGGDHRRAASAIAAGASP